MKKNVLIIIIILILAVAAILAPKFLTKFKNNNSEIEDVTTLDSTSSTKQKPAKTKKTPVPVAISIKDFAFSSTKKTVSKGTKVTWTNKDTAPHTIMSDNKNGPKSQLLNEGSKYSFTFNTAGTFKYYCSVHPTMTGTITVK